MSYWGGAWSSLKFSTRSNIASLTNNAALRFRNASDGVIKYRNNRAYKSVAVYVAKTLAVQTATAEVAKLFPRYQRYLEKKMRDTVLAQQDANFRQLIENRRKVTSELGYVYTPDGHRYVAKDKYGVRVDTALMLSYEGTKEIEVSDTATVTENDYFGTQYRPRQGSRQYMSTFKTKTICHIDLLAEVTMSSGKNLVQTKVQGRDFTRKELISGGDLTFQINGKLVGNMGEYPSTAVEKLVMVAQYKGIVSVNHFLFKHLNVDKVIITDFSLGKSDAYNEQPYSMTCVAIEPDEDVMIQKDTIGILNQELRLGETNSWYRFILNNKLAEIAADTVTSATTTGISKISDLLIDTVI